MKKLLALVLVMVLALASLTSCDVKESVSNGFGKVKTTVGGWFGIEFEEEEEPSNETPGTQTPDVKPDAPVKENYAAKAISSLKVIYGEVDPKTAANYDLIYKYTVPGTDIVLTVHWAADSEYITFAESANPNNITVVVPNDNEEDINYTLTATILDADGNVASASFDRYVPSVNTFMTPDEYYAAETGTAIVVKGIVTGIINKTNGQKYNQIYVNDENYGGGYYVYDIAETSIDDLKVGMTVKVTGVKEKTSYNEQRIKEAVIDILDETIKTVTPVDYTDIYLGAAELTDTNLVYKAGMLVTLKGVEITGQTLTNGYYHFKLGDKESYVRISSSTCCLYGDDLKTFKETHTNNKGNMADVVGVIATYDKAFYIVPVSVNAYSNITAITRTDAEKVQYELDAIDFATAVKNDATFELAVAGKMYEDVVISWTSDNACAVVSADGKELTITLGDEAQTVTLTVTATLGEATLTKTFTVSVSAKSKLIMTTVTAPEVGVAYKFYLFQGNLKKDLFFTGKMQNTYYYGTTGDINQAIDVYLEAAEGGYYITAVVDNVKRYFNITPETKESNGTMKTYYNTTIDFDGLTVYTFDTTYNALTATIDGKSFYFGTSSTSTYETVSANQNPASIFLVHLVTVTNVDDMTDAEKIAAEISKFDIDTNVTADKEITLPTASVNGVSVEWTVSGDAEIKDGKLVLTLGKEAKTVVLTAIIVAGETKEVKTYTFELPKKSNKVLTPMYTLEEGVAYKIVGKNAAGFIYFNGKIDNSRIDGAADIANSVDVYVKFVDKEAGTFLLYFMDGTTVKYIDSYVNESTKTAGFKIVTEAELSGGTWSINEQKAIVSSVNGRAISTQDNSTYTTFSTYALSNLGTGNYFTSYLAAFVEEVEVTDEDMVKAEAEDVKIVVTEVMDNFELTLPVPTKYADKVTFDWASNNACAVIVDGKLVITLPAEDTVVTITLVIVAGETKEVKTFDIKVTVPTYNVVKVTSPVADKAYKLYMEQVNISKKLFFNGKISGDYLQSTLYAAEAVDVYLEATEGGYYIYIINADGTKTYIDMYEKTSGSVRIRLVSEPSCVFVMHETLNTIASVTITTSNGKTNQYYFGTYNTYDTFSANSDYYVLGDKASQIGVSQFIAYLVEVSCKHDFVTECDTTCDLCGETRETTVAHTYTDDCDAACDCGVTREAPHKYVSECDTACDACGVTRETTVLHTYANDCDVDCDRCGATREASEHKYAACDDTDCEVCGATREPLEHKYEKCDSTKCEACGATREPLEHKYASCDDTDCDVCGATREPLEHKYAGCEDTDCDVCGATREASKHTFVGCDDTDCEVCGATREALAHKYANCDDTDCDVCGATREAVDHAYSSVCDDTCNNMGCDNVRGDAVDCKDENGDKICDNEGCGKEMGADTPALPVEPVTE